MMHFLLACIVWTLLLAILCLGPIKLWCIVKRRRSSRVLNWALLGALVLLPVVSQSCYMFLDEPLVEAARSGDCSQVNCLLRMGASVDCEADDGRGTALVAAISERHADVARLLIARGANVNQAANCFTFAHGSQTPLQAATGQPEVVTMLRNAGARE